MKVILKAEFKFKPIPIPINELTIVKGRHCSPRPRRRRHRRFLRQLLRQADRRLLSRPLLQR